MAIRVVINFLFPMFSLLDFSSAAFSSPRQMDFVAEGKAAWTEEPGQVAGRRALEEEAPPASSCCGKMRLAGQRLRPGHPGPPEQSLPLPPPDPRDLEEPTSAEGPVKCGFREARAPSPCPAKFTSASRKKGIVEMAHQGHRVSDGEARGPRPPEKASWAGVGGTGYAGAFYTLCVTSRALGTPLSQPGLCPEALDAQCAAGPGQWGTRARA